MRKMAVLVLALALVAAACGGDDSADPASLDNCDGILDAGVGLLETAIEAFDAMSTEDLMALADSDNPPEAITTFETDGRALAARAETLGCDQAELTAGLGERIDDIESESFFGQAILEAIRGGEIAIFEE